QSGGAAVPSCAGYRFSRFELDLIRGCLREGDREIKLRPKAFVVLRHLIEQAGRLLSKDELVAGAMPGIHLAGGSLVQCILGIRRALDDAQDCIKPAPGRGYLFAARVAPVEPVVAAAGSPSRPPVGVPRLAIARSHGLLALCVAVAIGLGAAI